MKNGRIMLACCALMLGMAPAWAGADQPPDWRSFTVCTENKRYCAEVAREAQREHPWEAYHKLTAWEDNDGQRRQLWARRYKHDGYPGGLITRDGSAFVHVSPWYHVDTVISIYRKEGLVEVAGRDFGIPESSLQNTVSHQLWLADGENPCELVDNDTLAVRTRDGRRHHVDLKTGELKQ